MAVVIYRCGSAQRREAVQNCANINGIDRLEVTVPASSSQAIRQMTLYFLKSLHTPLAPENFQIVNRQDASLVRITSIKPLSTEKKAEKINAVEITVAAPGNLSIYTLRLRQPNSVEPPTQIDPRLAEVDFTFRREQPANLREAGATTPAQAEPEINYLAKDYASFRRLMLDRLALLLPDGVEEQPADLQVALVELLAYTADRLSYYQDAVATEAYLGTARSRVSLRRHARLLGYKLHEGCNARVWMCCTVNWQQKVDSNWRFLTDGVEPVVFEPCHTPTLYPQHNQIDLYNWGDDPFTLSSGATCATLKQNSGLNLKLTAGNLLCLEAAGEETDTTRCHIVRLTAVRGNGEGKTLTDPISKQEIVEIEWDAEDALPFDLPVYKAGKNVAVARGNVVLADHGRSLAGQSLASSLRLPEKSLTYAEPLPDDFTGKKKGAFTSAAGLLRRNSRAALPQIKLTGDNATWLPQYDLLASDGTKAVFVVETEHNGSARLRFGDGAFGRRPISGVSFDVSYRRGNGRAGHVGAEMICRIEAPNVVGVTVRNPLPAVGGEDPEPAEQVRLFAPQAFRTQQRAINSADYAACAQSFPGVQRAAALIRWTGSWYTVYLFIDRIGGRALNDDFKQRLLRHMDGYRLAGYDLEICDPTYVPLTIISTLEVKPGSSPNAVMAALTAALSPQELAGGRRGYFHPDNWTFGQPVYLSQFYSAALAVPGVAAIHVQKFQRNDRPGHTARDQGLIAIGPHEIVAPQIELKPELLQLTIRGMV